MKKIIAFILIFFICASCATTTPKKISEAGRNISLVFSLPAFTSPQAAMIWLAGISLFAGGELVDFVIKQREKQDIEQEQRNNNNKTENIY